MDKRITRIAARRERTSVLMFGRWWDLEPFATYRIDYNRAEPSKSRIVRV